MKDIEEDYRKFGSIIKSRLEEFSKRRHPETFYEMCFCITTPQSNAKRCNEAIMKLMQEDFLNKDIAEDKVKSILHRRTRFHNNKARYLLLAKTGYNSIMELCSKPMAARELRNEIAKRVKGMGMKEASHFLRNIGFREVAILDRHILKNLKKHGAISEVPKHMTAKEYMEIEKKFEDFAKEAGIAMDELDLLFWARETGEVFK